MHVIVDLISAVCGFLWGDLITLPLPGGGSVGLSLLVLLLIPTGIYFTFRTRFLPIRLFPEMLRVTAEKRGGNGGAISGWQALIISTATRVGMGNLIGVVAAISAGGAGAVFWMWLSALIGSSTAFIEATLAQLHKKPDPLYGGYRGGPAYYIHDYFAAASPPCCSPCPASPAGAASARSSATPSPPPLKTPSASRLFTPRWCWWLWRRSSFSGKTPP